MADDSPDVTPLSATAARKLEATRDDESLPPDVRRAAADELIRRPRERVPFRVLLPSWLRRDHDEADE